MQRSFFHKKHMTPEDLAIYVVRKQQRSSVLDSFREEGYEATPEDIERTLDLLIQKMKENGEIKKILDRYLAVQIEEQRSRGGFPSKH
jgi:hypothetical protein